MLDLATELSQLAELRRNLRHPPALLLLDFPRPSDLKQAADAGIASVLAKPYLIADLAEEIERITGAPSEQRLIAAA
jgi:CheY-like chemotaxis protein